MTQQSSSEFRRHSRTSCVITHGSNEDDDGEQEKGCDVWVMAGVMFSSPPRPRAARAADVQTYTASIDSPSTLGGLRNNIRTDPRRRRGPGDLPEWAPGSQLAQVS